MSRQQRRALKHQQQSQKPLHTQVNASVPAPVCHSANGGPRTPEGKAISSRNALTHGLTSAKTVLPWESQSDFNQLLDGLVSDHQPVTITEQIMVREMAEQYWRLLRARGDEHALLSRTDEILDRNDPPTFLAWEKSLALIGRYVTRYERSFHKCLATLRTLQKERLAKEAELEAEAAEAAGETAQPVIAASEFVSQNEVTPSAVHTFVSQNGSIQSDSVPSTRSQAA